MSPPSGTAPAATAPCGSGLARERALIDIDEAREEAVRGQGRSHGFGTSASAAARLNTGAGADAERPILALGAWFKHAACLLDADGWTFGPNLGDLDNADACAGVEPAVQALLARAPAPVRAVAHDLHPDFHSTRVALADGGLLFIENVGNLVCPAAFDLGEAHKAVILSVTEGEDKPLKYPDMFAAADLMLLNKVDLLPYLHFDVERAIGYALRVNPRLQVIRTSATSGEGLDAWLAWLEARRADVRRSASPQTTTPE